MKLMWSISTESDNKLPLEEFLMGDERDCFCEVILCVPSLSSFFEWSSSSYYPDKINLVAEFVESKMKVDFVNRS